MDPNKKCKVCGRAAQNILDEWNSAPCLMRLEPANPECLDDIMHEAVRRGKKVAEIETERSVR